MKAIIFDLDNTLIKWSDDFLFALRNVLKTIDPNATEERVISINEVIAELEDVVAELTKENFLDFVNKKCGTNYDISFVDMLIEEQKKCYYKDEKLEKMLDFLSKKYDMYVITNWFTETQVGRLKNMNISKYFKKIIGAEINYLKPQQKAFDIILKEYKPEDCVSIGDSFKKDIDVPLKLGMKAIWLTDETMDGVTTIKSLDELWEVL